MQVGDESGRERDIEGRGERELDRERVSVDGDRGREREREKDTVRESVNDFVIGSCVSLLGNKIGLPDLFVHA